MKLYIAAYFGALITYLIMDGVWLGLVARESYVQSMGDLLRDKPYPIAPWVIFYLSYCVAIVHLVISPNIDGSWKAVACSGALLGFVAYGAYNFTNYAVIAGWPLGITIKDLVWGTFVTTASSLVGWKVYHYFSQ
ncbi:MAG: DUF2177 family protein [Rickettsiales bacterium]|nr:DUF2177 family protein [Rickettsiales bacterium]